MKKIRIPLVLLCLILLVSCNHTAKDDPKSENLRFSTIQPNSEIPTPTKTSTTKGSQSGLSGDAGKSTGSNTTTSKYEVSPITIPNPSDITSEELESNYKEFTKLIEGLKAEDFDSVKLSTTTPSGTQEFSSSDVQLIIKWIALLKKMQFVSDPFVPVSGTGFSLDFICKGKEQYVAGIVGKYVYTTSGRTMLIIKNYDALSDEISTLVDQMKNSAK